MTKKFQHLVVDSGPLIQNSFSVNLAENFYTIPEVIGEIRDADTRERLAKLPFELKLKNPTTKSLQLVKDFAKATGDAASLSAVDLKVVALTLTLEQEFNGDSSQARTCPSEIVVHKGALRQCRNSLIQRNGTPSIPAAAGVNVPNLDDDEGWITPENIAEIKAKMTVCHIEEQAEQHSTSMIAVGCISTDFAVQNLLLQMKLKLCGPEGYCIRQVKNWLLRCHACYWTTKQMERRFCDRCGNPSLLRTSFMVDSTGQTHLFLKKDFQYKNKGTIAPIPMPKAGRKDSKMLLREDQKEYQQAMKSFQRQERKMERMNELDTIDDRLATVFGGMSISGAVKDLSATGLPVIGFGRRNPNQSRRRV